MNLRIKIVHLRFLQIFATKCVMDWCKTLYFLNFAQKKSKDKLGGSNLDLAVFPEFSYIQHQGITMKLTILAPPLALDLLGNCIIHHNFP